MYTDINVRCMDQVLQLTNAPRIASGGVNVVRLNCTFDDKWLGLGCTAVFYRSPEAVYHIVMEGGSCVVPWEVLAEPGRLYFGIVGVEDGAVVRTTEVLTLIIDKGAPTESTMTAEEPTPDVYQQILAAYGRVDSDVREAKDAAVAAAEEAASLAAALGGCWISFTDEKGNPTDEPYIHWQEVTE